MLKELPCFKFLRTCLDGSNFTKAIVVPPGFSSSVSGKETSPDIFIKFKAKAAIRKILYPPFKSACDEAYSLGFK